MTSCGDAAASNARSGLVIRLHFHIPEFVRAYSAAARNLKVVIGSTVASARLRLSVLYCDTLEKGFSLLCSCNVARHHLPGCACHAWSSAGMLPKHIFCWQRPRFSWIQSQGATIDVPQTAWCGAGRCARLLTYVEIFRRYAPSTDVESHQSWQWVQDNSARPEAGDFFE